MHRGLWINRTHSTSVASLALSPCCSGRAHACTDQHDKSHLFAGGIQVEAEPKLALVRFFRAGLIPLALPVFHPSFFLFFSPLDYILLPLIDTSHT